MYVDRLALTDFRSYADLDVELGPGVHAFIGANGAGKTNIVEAIGYLARLASHRNAADAPLIRLGAEQALIRAVVVRDGRSTTVELEINSGRSNRARLGGAPVPRPREVLGLVRAVIFAPEDLVLVRGDPSDRRRWIDDLLIARAPRFAAVRADYDRVLKQRNALLKSARLAGDLRTLDTWDAHLAHTGAQLLVGRLDALDALRPLVDKAYAALSSGPAGEPTPGSGEGVGRSAPQVTTSLDYRASFDADGDHGGGSVIAAGGDSRAGGRHDVDVLTAALTAAIAQERPHELERGISLVGPHRDEIVLGIGPLPARGYASHGESWSLALALQLAAYELLAAEGAEPILVLDDVFAELDGDRRDRLVRLVAGAEQVFVTAAVASDVPDVLAGSRFDVADGEVRRVR
jgi:DNA replication and repair protein RecF